MGREVERCEEEKGRKTPPAKPKPWAFRCLSRNFWAISNIKDNAEKWPILLGGFVCWANKMLKFIRIDRLATV